MEGEGTEPRELDHNQVQTIITRLRELRRKCAGFAARNDEFALMGERLDSIIGSLEAGLEPEAEPIAFRELSRQLVAVERLFESTGFMNVARVVSSIEGALESLAPIPREPPPAPASAAEPTADGSGTPDTIAHGESEERGESGDETAGGSAKIGARFPLLWLYLPCGACLAWLVCRRQLSLDELPAGIVTLVAGLGLGIVVSWVHRHTAPLFSIGRDQRALGIMISALLLVPWCLAGLASLVLIALGHAVPPQVATTEATSLEEGAAPETGRPASPTPIPEEPGEPLIIDEVVLERVPVEIEQADTALHNGDITGARKHLAVAAAIDPHHRLVQEMAEAIIDALLAEAGTAIEEAEWQAAETSIAQARSLATELYLDTRSIDQAEQHYATMARYQDVSPHDIATVRAAIGSFMIVTLRDRDTVSGRLVSFDNGELLLDVKSGVSGGQVRFEKKIPMRVVKELRIWPRE